MAPISLPDLLLRRVAIAVATFDLPLFPVARFGGVPAPEVVRWVTIATVALLIALFLRILFDSRVRRALTSASHDAQTAGRGRLGLRDPEWGLFGTRMGGGYLAVLRAALFLAFIVVALFLGTEHRPSAATILVMAAFGITLLLTMLQLAQWPNEAGD